MNQLAFTPEMLNRRTVHPFPARMAANIPWEILSPRRGCLRVLDPMAGDHEALKALIFLQHEQLLSKDKELLAHREQLQSKDEELLRKDGSGAATPQFSECLYFSVVTFSSLGYGDFRPIGVSRLLASAEVIIGLAFLGIAIAKLSSARQSYYTARLFSSDAQARLDKFSIGFDELMKSLNNASGTEKMQEIIETTNVRCVALLNYIKFEIANGPFFDDVPMRAVRRVIRYLAVLLTSLVQNHAEDLQSGMGRKLFRNATLLMTVIEHASHHTFLLKDCAKLRLVIERARKRSLRSRAGRIKLGAGAMFDQGQVEQLQLDA